MRNKRALGKEMSGSMSRCAGSSSAAAVALAARAFAARRLQESTRANVINARLVARALSERLFARAAAPRAALFRAPAPPSSRRALESVFELAGLADPAEIQAALAVVRGAMLRPRGGYYAQLTFMAQKYCILLYLPLVGSGPGPLQRAVELRTGPPAAGAELFWDWLQIRRAVVFAHAGGDFVTLPGELDAVNSALRGSRALLEEAAGRADARKRALEDRRRQRIKPGLADEVHFQVERLDALKERQHLMSDAFRGN